MATINNPQNEAGVPQSWCFRQEVVCLAVLSQRQKQQQQRGGNSPAGIALLSGATRRPARRSLLGHSAAGFQGDLP